VAKVIVIPCEAGDEEGQAGRGCEGRQALGYSTFTVRRSCLHVPEKWVFQKQVLGMKESSHGGGKSPLWIFMAYGDNVPKAGENKK
jgi:hypothetical protein